VDPIASVAELRADGFDPDQDLDEFLADLDTDAASLGGKRRLPTSIARQRRAPATRPSSQAPVSSRIPGAGST
jgi:hypothetical protein